MGRSKPTVEKIIVVSEGNYLLGSTNASSDDKEQKTMAFF